MREEAPDILADCGCSGFVSAMPISDMPYRSNRKCPEIAFQVLNTGSNKNESIEQRKQTTKQTNQTKKS